MNATGTERQRAVIAAYRMAPTALQAEIARAAGVSASYVVTVLGDYLESKAREQASQMPTCTASNPTEHDVADFAPDRRIGGNCGPDACAVKEGAIRVALAANPRAEGEAKMKYCKRIAAIARVSFGYVQLTLKIIEYKQIGAAVRAREAEDAKLKCQVVPFSGNIGPVQHFTSWLDVFGKFQITAMAYLQLAQSRGDVYATAFLKDLRDTADRAATRAAMRKTG